MADPNDNGGAGYTLGGGSGDRPPTGGSGASGTRARGPNASRSAAPRMATLADLNASNRSSTGRSSHGQPRASSDDDDEEEGGKRETWFTGGERSGLSVQNPERGPSFPGGDLVRALLQKAEQEEARTSAPSTGGSNRTFRGAGHTLGSDEVESRYIPDEHAPPEVTHHPGNQEQVIRHLTFWRNGFTIENGPLLQYDDPANREIIQSMDSGQAPPHLFGLQLGQPVKVRMTRRADEDYKPPPVSAFSGSGLRLGAPVPALAGGTSSSTMPGSFPAASGSSSASAAREALSVQTKFEVDQSQPTTSIQLRLADGTRMVCRMNLTHTIRDIRNFINAARPENLTRPYTIATTFPNRILDDDTQTIDAAGLKNSVVVQRWT